jgi:predicted metalloenzyme YecM
VQAQYQTIDFCSRDLLASKLSLVDSLSRHLELDLRGIAADHLSFACSCTETSRNRKAKYRNTCYIAGEY